MHIPKDPRGKWHSLYVGPLGLLDCSPDHMTNGAVLGAHGVLLVILVALDGHFRERALCADTPLFMRRHIQRICVRVFVRVCVTR